MAAQPTKFTAPLRRVAPFIGASCLVAPFLPAPLPAAPFALLAMRMLHGEEGDGALARGAKVALMSSAWVGWSTLVAWAPLHAAFGLPPAGWMSLVA